MPSSPSLTVPLTSARTQLFRLAEQLLSGEVEQVRLSHRSHDDELVLVRASVLAALEREVVSLREQLAPAPRALWGMASCHEVDADAILVASRAESAMRADSKLDDLVREVHARAATPGRVAEPKVGRTYRARRR